MLTARIGYDNLSDAATFSASSQVLLAPVSRLQNPHVGVKWQATGGSEFFVCDYGAQTSIDVFRVMGLAADTIRLRYSTSDPSAGDLYDTGVISIDQRFMTHTDIRSLNPRYVRCDLTSDGAVEAGRVFSGILNAFDINPAWGWQRKWVDPSDRKKTEGGQTRINRRDKYRQFSLNFEFLSDAEASGFTDDIDRVNGLTDDILFIVNPESTDLEQDSIFGLMTDLSPTAQQFLDRWTKQYTIEQRL